MATHFVVVRHGETAWNAQSRIQGHLDSPLNEEGLAQAILVADRLARESFAALYCSDLGRALQTVQPIADRLSLPVQREPRLRERNLGVFQGLTGIECERAYPEDYARFKARAPDHQVPDGESVRQVYERVERLFSELAERHIGQRVAVVTHGGVLDAIFRLVNRVPLDRERDFPIYNASINAFRYEAQQWSMDSWGDISHLTRDATLDDF
jgi:probable phosphoglycerate mutase